MEKTQTIDAHLSLLGLPMKDKVTDFEGMVDSVSFDVYGCVQACLKPKVASDGKVPGGYWFDVKRLKTTGKRLMEIPPHMTTPPGQEAGPADKPVFTLLPDRD